MFPDFNLYSCSLLFVSLQGLIFSLLLFRRAFKYHDKLDLILATILLITAYDQVSYCLGFLGWYDTFRYTKINYFVFNVHLILAPLIYLYIRSICKPQIQFSKRDILHFIPILINIILKAAIYLIDRGQHDFQSIQNGDMVLNYQWDFLDPIFLFVTIVQMSIYMFLSFSTLSRFREKIRQYFSNSFKLELQWLFAFLIIYSLLFVYLIIQTGIDELITDLSWRQEWFYFLLSGIALIYLGIKGYFLDLEEIKNLDFRSFLKKDISKNVNDKVFLKNQNFDELKKKIEGYMELEKPYLDPKLTLVKLANQLNISREELSGIINESFGHKFNTFINRYRIEEFKTLTAQGKHQSLTILGLAFECGFNSKATFNRSFKKELNMSPSMYIQSIDKQ